MRIGAVSYLNTKPLIEGLADRRSDIDLIVDLPSRLADRLARGELDVALIPSIEFFQTPGYQIISDACIGCRGPVMSVKVLFRRPPAEVKTLALDEGSRTSAALSRILLAERFDVRPQLEPLPIGSGAADTTADAVLLIGDRAMHPVGETFVEEWDLGDVWCRWSELSFVFAMWVARPGVDLTGVDTLLSEARDRGVAKLEEIAHREYERKGITYETCLTYLRDNLYFYLGQRELAGLNLYYEHAAAMGLAPQGLVLPKEPLISRR